MCVKVQLEEVRAELPDDQEQFEVVEGYILNEEDILYETLR